MTQKTVGILLFDEVEVLDFAGPFEVFSVTGQRQGPAQGKSDGAFDVYTIAEEAGVITARNGLRVVPDKCFADDPQPDILLIPAAMAQGHCWKSRGSSTGLRRALRRRN